MNPSYEQNIYQWHDNSYISIKYYKSATMVL